MDKDKLPPDPGSVSRIVLDTIVTEAADSPVFRCSLRERPDLISNLTCRDIRGILRGCQAPKVYFNSDDEAREALRRYLEFHEESDENWRINCTKSGTKRQPSLNQTLEASSSKHQAQSVPRPSLLSVDEQNQSNLAIPHSGSALSLASTLRSVNDGISGSVSALAEAAGLLQLTIRGEQPSKERMQESLARIQLATSAAQGVQIGLKACVDVLSLPGTVDPLRAPQHTSTPLKPFPRESTTNVSSYASAVKSNKKPQNRKSTSHDKLVRKQMAEERKQTRCDARSIRLRPLIAQGIVNNGSLVREICKFLSFKGVERDLIEEVRLDRRGCYYCQVKEIHFKETLKLLLERSDSENIIKFPNLGKWRLNEPAESLSVNKKPIVVYGIDVNIQPETFVCELWESNKVRWGIESADRMSAHLANPSRLNKRSSPPANGAKEGTSNSWCASRNMKIYVSKHVYQELSRPGHKFVAFDYNYVRTDDFRDRKRLCDNCGVFGYHHAGTCRRASHCYHCGGNHPASQCPSNQISETKDKGNVNNSPRIEEDDEMLFHDCSQSISSSGSLKDWEEATTREQPVNNSDMAKPSSQWPGRTPGHT